MTSEGPKVDMWAEFVFMFNQGDEVVLVTDEDEIKQGRLQYDLGSDYFTLKRVLGRDEVLSWDIVRFIAHDGMPVKKLRGADGSASLLKEESVADRMKQLGHLLEEYEPRELYDVLGIGEIDSLVHAERVQLFDNLWRCIYGEGKDKWDQDKYFTQNPVPLPYDWDREGTKNSSLLEKASLAEKRKKFLKGYEPWQVFEVLGFDSKIWWEVQENLYARLWEYIYGEDRSEWDMQRYEKHNPVEPPPPSTSKNLYFGDPFEVEGIVPRLVNLGNTGPKGGRYDLRYEEAILLHTADGAKGILYDTSTVFV